MKSKQSPIWTDQKFDRLRIEVEKWYDNNKALDEEKYIDLLESLKKNYAAKGYLFKTVV